MNRQHRRAQAQRQDPVSPHRARVAAAPQDAKVRNELACALLAQGKFAEASEQFACALSLMPELFEQYAHIVAALLQVNPALRASIDRLPSGSGSAAPLASWLPPSDFLAIARDPLLRALLEMSPVRDIHLERFLTVARRGLLGAASGCGPTHRLDKTSLEFCCALARQCFLNEYVFAIEDKEQERVERLQESLAGALARGSPIPPLWPALLGSYVPLGSLPAAELLFERTWPSAVRGVLRQQLIEPKEERQVRGSIPRITAIEERVSLLVQKQYEANPYPRWVAPPSAGKPLSIEDYLGRLFPSAHFEKPARAEHVDILVAGCGTGQQSIATARRFIGANVLAVDLSLSSLAYAKRMSDVLSVRNVEYAQADILNLGKIGRSFDVIEASGVLHHMAEPMEAWRMLLSLLRPGGFMNVGLYSRTGRQLVQRAREFVVEKGYRPTREDIRRLRQDVLFGPLNGMAKWGDYYTASECRDLLFHVQEHQTTIAEIARFIEEHRLTFIGFHVLPEIAEAYRRRFPNDVSLSDLSCWSRFEDESPYVFASMYQFWVQKT